jgi:hypothetical protein
VLVLDRFGDRLVDVSGTVDRTADPDLVRQAVDQLTRHRGPVTVLPTVWVVQGTRFTELSSGDRASAAVQLVSGSDAPFALVIGRA